MSCSKFDFDEIIPRRGTNSYKWDTPDGDDILPLWVADMDFRTAPPVVETPPAPPAPPVVPDATAPQPMDAPAPPPPIEKKPKQPLGTPKLGVPPQMGQTPQSSGMSFQAILSGQAFNPQQGG